MYTKAFADIIETDLLAVGSKTYSLAQMYRQLGSEGIVVPDGFALTTEAYHALIATLSLESEFAELYQLLDLGLEGHTDRLRLAEVAATIRSRIATASLPAAVVTAISTAYEDLAQRVAPLGFVAVRSSATAEDLPTSSAAGQQESFLQVTEEQLLTAVKNCFASLFTERAILYRFEHKICQRSVALAVCVQQMVRSDRGSSGVIFTLDTETGNRNLLVISAASGTGDQVVQGLVTPDEYWVSKVSSTVPQLIVGKKRGSSQATSFVLSDEQILLLARHAVTIENFYRRPVDIEWAYDRSTGTFAIVQARPETVNGVPSVRQFITTKVVRPAGLVPLVTGSSVGSAAITGRVRLVVDPHAVTDLASDEIIVTRMTDPDWMPLLRKARGMVTDIGGRTCHAAIVSRELQIPTIVGTGDGTAVLQDGQLVTLDTTQGATGAVYAGALPLQSTTTALDSLPALSTALMVNLADPETACQVAQLPVAGVGLIRLEFMMASSVGVHPCAILAPERIADPAVCTEIERRCAPYGSGEAFIVDQIAAGVGRIAASFYPRPVTVRLSDFKSNEYRDLLGGRWFEPLEENPMLGLRGAARYLHSSYQQAFLLECKALKKIVASGLTNLRVMVPFVRTLREAAQVVTLLQEQQLSAAYGVPLVMMVEVPSNVILLEQFAQYFDGFSIGSNDLTQLTLGIDRDSGTLAQSFDERDPAVQALIRQAIKKAHSAGKFIGICGQGPSDYPEFAAELIAQGIDSISLTPDAIIPFLETIKASGGQGRIPAPQVQVT